MPLNRRQERLYNSVANLYRPMPLRTNSDGGAIDLRYPAEPAYSGVRCYKVESQELNQPSAVGRNNYDIAMTIDQFKFVIEQEIGDGWLIWIRPTEGNASDRERGQMYVVQGGSQDKPNVGRRTVNQRKVFAVRVVKPPTVTGEPFTVPRPVLD